jgi:hypothetical protein
MWVIRVCACWHAQNQNISGLIQDILSHQQLEGRHKPPCTSTETLELPGSHQQARFSGAARKRLVILIEWKRF